MRWAVRSPEDTLLDPSCGDGSFLRFHSQSTGIEREPLAAALASQSAPGSTVVVDDFFRWASTTPRQFDCVAGNPPFVRYQLFAGETRRRAIELCSRQGVRFSGLSSSWAPFLVAAAGRLKPGGRMAFVVPAEVGHSPYAAPFINYLMRSFKRILFVAYRNKIFPKLSQDVWLLYAEGFGGNARQIEFARRESFRVSNRPPTADIIVGDGDLEGSGNRLRWFLLPKDVLDFYRNLANSTSTIRLREVARVGIGYVTGANDFFHLRPSTARSLRISKRFLLPTVRNSRDLPPRAVTTATVEAWSREDDPYLLLRLTGDVTLPKPVADYLSSDRADAARAGYKCRNRKPWYVVPDVVVPDGFLSYMSGREPCLVANQANCACTNSIHAVRLQNGLQFSTLQRAWRHPLAQLSSEIEGHPLGGGMLKLEPREAAAVVLPRGNLTLAKREISQLEEGTAILRRWRHHD